MFPGPGRQARSLASLMTSSEHFLRSSELLQAMGTRSCPAPKAKGKDEGGACSCGWKAEVCNLERLPGPPVATFLEQWVVASQPRSASSLSQALGARPQSRGKGAPDESAES